MQRRVRLGGRPRRLDRRQRLPKRPTGPDRQRDGRERRAPRDAVRTVDQQRPLPEETTGRVRGRLEGRPVGLGTVDERSVMRRRRLWLARRGQHGVERPVGPVRIRGVDVPQKQVAVADTSNDGVAVAVAERADDGPAVPPPVGAMHGCWAVRSSADDERRVRGEIARFAGVSPRRRASSRTARRCRCGR